MRIPCCTPEYKPTVAVTGDEWQKNSAVGVSSNSALLIPKQHGHTALTRRIPIASFLFLQPQDIARASRKNKAHGHNGRRIKDNATLRLDKLLLNPHVNKNQYSVFALYSEVRVDEQPTIIHGWLAAVQQD
jgi:hypothetical protein